MLFAYLFGSAATGAPTPRSDIDLAVFVAPDMDLHAAQLAVARVAARQLGTDAVDVVLLNTAPVSLAGRVLGSRGVLLDRDPYAIAPSRPRHGCSRTSASGSGAYWPPGPRMVDRDLIILVYDYTRLDPAIVIRVLQTELGDLERFRDAARTIA